MIFNKPAITLEMPTIYKKEGFISGPGRVGLTFE